MRKTKKKYLFWDSVAKKMSKQPYIVKIFAEYKRDEYARLINRWCGHQECTTVLKTDLFEEAQGEDPFLFDVFKKSELFGLDISKVVVKRASEKARILKKNLFCIVGDVLTLPYEDSSFDLIISNSTLDHLTRQDMRMAISELKRVLKDSGKIILTINNRHNIIFYLMSKLAIFLTVVPFPIEFYTLGQMRKLFSESELKVEKTTPIIHLLSPVNKVLLIASKILKEPKINKVALFFVRIAKNISQKRTKYFTGWFLAFLLSKERARNEITDER